MAGEELRVRPQHRQQPPPLPAVQHHPGPQAAARRPRRPLAGHVLRTVLGVVVVPHRHGALVPQVRAAERQHVLAAHGAGAGGRDGGRGGGRVGGGGELEDCVDGARVEDVAEEEEAGPAGDSEGAVPVLQGRVPVGVEVPGRRAERRRAGSGELWGGGGRMEKDSGWGRGGAGRRRRRAGSGALTCCRQGGVG